MLHMSTPMRLVERLANLGGQGKDIRHDPFERAWLPPRIPFDACETVIGP